MTPGDVLRGLSWKQAMLRLLEPEESKSNECMMYQLHFRKYSQPPILRLCIARCCYAECPWEVRMRFDHEIRNHVDVTHAICSESTILTAPEHIHAHGLSLLLPSDWRSFFIDIFRATAATLPDLQTLWPLKVDNLCQALSRSFRYWLSDSKHISSEGRVYTTLEYATTILGTTDYSLFPPESLPQIFPCLLQSNFASRPPEIYYHVEWNITGILDKRCTLCTLASKIGKIEDQAGYCAWHYDISLLVHHSEANLDPDSKNVFYYARYCLLRDAPSFRGVNCYGLHHKNDIDSFLDLALCLIGIPALYQRVLQEAQADSQWDMSVDLNSAVIRGRAVILRKLFLSVVNGSYPFVYSTPFYYTELKNFLKSRDAMAVCVGPDYKDYECYWGIIDGLSVKGSDEIQGSLQLLDDDMLLNRLCYTLVKSGEKWSPADYKAMLPPWVVEVAPYPYRGTTEDLHNMITRVVEKAFKFKYSQAYSHAPPKKKRCIEFRILPETAERPAGHRKFPASMTSHEKKELVRDHASLVVLSRMYPLRVITIHRSDEDFEDQLKLALSRLGTADSNPIVLRGVAHTYVRKKFSQHPEFMNDKTKYDRWYNISPGGLHETENKQRATGFLSDYIGKDNKALVAIDRTIPSYLPDLVTLLSIETDFHSHLPQCWRRERYEKQFFLATSEGYGPLHYDSLGTVYLALEGERIITFCHPSVSFALQKREEHHSETYHPYTGRVSFQSMIPNLEVSLKPGDMGIFDKGLWHCVKGVPDSSTRVTAACNWVFACDSYDIKFREFSKKMRNTHSLLTFLDSIEPAAWSVMTDPQDIVNQAIESLADVQPMKTR